MIEDVELPIYCVPSDSRFQYKQTETCYQPASMVSALRQVLDVQEGLFNG